MSDYKVNVRIAGQKDSSLDSAISAAKSALSGLGKSALSGIGSLAGSALSSGISAIKDLATSSVEAGISYESAFAGVRKTVNATDEELAAFDAGIRQMATEMPTSAAEIAGVAESAGQLGIQNDNLLSFTKTMVQLGDATNLSADEAATTLARFANVTGMDQANFSNLGSSIVALGNNFATTESEIADMAQNLGAAGTQVGMSQSEILGWSAALSSVGMEAAAGGTAMSTLMTNMQVAVETGGESLKQFANVAGMSAEEFATTFQTAASDTENGLSGSTNAMMAFFSGLNDTERLGKSAISTLDDMGITETRLRDTILRAAGASDSFNDALTTSNSAWEENTALSNEVSQRYSTMESQIDILKNKATNMGISFYNSISGPMASAVGGLSGIMDNLNTAFDTGGLVGMIGQLGSEITNTVLPSITEAIPGLVSAGADAISALADGFAEGLPGFLEQAGNLITTLGSALVDAAPQLLSAGATIAQAIFNAIVDGLGPIFSDIGQTVIDGLNGALSTLGFDFQLPSFDSITESIGSALDTGWTNLKNAAKETADALPGLIESGVSGIKTTLEGLDIGGALDSAWTTLSDGAQAAATGLAELVQPGFESLVSTLQGIDIGTAMDSGWETLKGAASGAVEWISEKVSGISNVVSKVVNFFTGGGEDDTSTSGSSEASSSTAVQQAPQVDIAQVQQANAEVQSLQTTLTTLQTTITTVQTAVSTGMTTISTTVTTGITTITTTVSTQTAALVAVCSSYGAQAVSIAVSTVSGIQSAFAGMDLTSAGINAMQGLISGLESMRASVMATASSIASAAASAVNSALQIHSPSKVLEESGQYSGEGLVLGMENMRGAVQNAAAQNLAAPVAQSMQNQTGFSMPQFNQGSSVIQDTLGRFSQGNNAAGGNGSGMQGNITYAPVFNITGSNLTQDDVVQENRISQSEFEKMLKEYMRSSGRSAFA